MAGATEATVALPTGSLSVGVGTPISSVPAADTDDRRALQAPAGGSIVPVRMSFDSGEQPWTPLLALEPEVPEVTLAVGDREYDLPAPYRTPGGTALADAPDDAFYVAVDASPEEARSAEIRIDYDGLLQTVSADGRVEAGQAAGLPAPGIPRAVPLDCPRSGWTVRGTSRPVPVGCEVGVLGLTPYWPGLGWAPTGRSWLVVEVETLRPDLSAVAAGDATAVADRSTVDGVRAVVPLQAEASGRPGVLGGRAVFSVPTATTVVDLRLGGRFRLPDDAPRGGEVSVDRTLRVRL